MLLYITYQHHQHQLAGEERAGSSSASSSRSSPEGGRILLLSLADTSLLLPMMLNVPCYMLLLQHTVLKSAPADPDALACKAVALLQDQEYEAADKVLQHKAIKEHMPLERVSSRAAAATAGQCSSNSHLFGNMRVGCVEPARADAAERLTTISALAAEPLQGWEERPSMPAGLPESTQGMLPQTKSCCSCVAGLQAYCCYRLGRFEEVGLRVSSGFAMCWLHLDCADDSRFGIWGVCPADTRKCWSLEPCSVHHLVHSPANCATIQIHTLHWNPRRASQLAPY